MDEQCRKEVLELHRFFEGWFNGTLAPSEENFSRFSGVMAPGFEIIFPNSRSMRRDELIEHVRRAHGIYAPEGRRIRLRIENCTCRPVAGDLRLLTYEEWQEGGGETRGRLSSAVLRRREGAPNDVEWLHVHEAWLPEPRRG